MDTQNAKNELNRRLGQNAKSQLNGRLGQVTGGWGNAQSELDERLGQAIRESSEGIPKTLWQHFGLIIGLFDKTASYTILNLTEP